VDFIYQNKVTSNVILVEIKTPVTHIIGKKYRDNAFSISEDCSGSINQLVNYKDELLKNFYTLRNQDEEDYRVFSPKCLLIVGCIETENLSPKELKSFELFRHELRNIDIITYDELFEKIDLLIKILENEWKSGT